MVDLIWLAGLEDWLASEGMEDSASCVHEAAKEIDILRKQLAEAKRQAIPWRDGPAKGGEMPTVYTSTVAVMDLRSGVCVITGEIDGGFLRRNGFLYDTEKIVRWCYESDLIPAEPEKSKVTNE